MIFLGCSFTVVFSVSVEEDGEVFNLDQNAGFLFVQATSQPLEGFSCLKKKLYWHPGEFVLFSQIFLIFLTSNLFSPKNMKMLKTGQTCYNWWAYMGNIWTLTLEWNVIASRPNYCIEDHDVISISLTKQFMVRLYVYFVHKSIETCLVILAHAVCNLVLVHDPDILLV